jgi:gamma-glutamyltranspeptidase/glutathione hydrolase
MAAQEADGGVGLGKPPASYRPSVPGVHGLVAAGHPLAAMAGLQVLMKGGNAIDAAVAVGTTLNMMEPQFNGIGGNGFMTIYDKRSGKVYSLAMAGAAPAAIKGADMTPETLNWGIDSGIVPGNFGGYITALQRFGTMSLAEVFASAIDYAEHGYPMDPTLASAIDRASKRLAEFPTTAKIFLPAGRPPVAGELFKNPDLAATLRKAVEAEQMALKQKKSRTEAIQAAFDRFYKGDIAQEMIRFIKENHGLMTAADLAAFHPIWAEPLHTAYSRLRRVQQSGDFTRRIRARDGPESGRTLGSRQNETRQPRRPASSDRSHQSHQGGRLSLRRRSEIHRHSGRGNACEKLRRQPAQADRAE